MVKFLTQIETAEPALFDIISDFVYGSVICAIVQARSDNLPKTLENVDVYLDTNVLFSILGFDHDEVARPRRELLTLLQREGCRLFAFDFTFEEMVCVLKGYRQSYQGLWETVRVNSIYSNLKRQGKAPYDVDVIIANLADVLQKLGISVVSTNHDYYSRPTEMRRILNSFLVYLEEDDSYSIIVTATNNVSLLDKALFRRFDDVLEYTKPDKVQIEQLLKMKLSEYALIEVFSDTVYEKALGLSHADVVKACENAIKHYVLNNGEITKAVLLMYLQERIDLYKHKELKIVEA